MISAIQVFHKHWRPFEEPFWAQEDRQVRFKKPRLEFFLANYLSAQTAHETNIGKLFSEYKTLCRTKLLSKRIG